MKTEIELLKEQFEEFKQSSKEIEDFLEQDLQDLSEKLIKKDNEIQELKEELHLIKSKFVNEASLIMKLQQDIGTLKKKLEEETKSKNSLEILNESYIEKLRILNFRISELEGAFNTAQEDLIFAKLEIEEKEKLRNAEISKLNLLIDDSRTKKVNKKIDFQVNGVLNKRPFSGHCRDRLLIGSEIYKYFHEFDEIMQTTVLEYFESEVKKIDSNSTFIFYGFRSVIRVLYRFFKDEQSWTCSEFLKNNEDELIQNRVDSKEIQDLNNLGERQKRSHYFHLVSLGKFTIQIFDLCEYDLKTSDILDEMIRASQQGKAFYDICERVFDTGKIILNLNCIDIDSLVKFANKANSLVHNWKSTQTSEYYCKDFNGILMSSMTSRNKEILNLKKKIKTAENESFVAKVMIKEKNRQSKFELNKWQGPLNQMNGIGIERGSSNLIRATQEFRNISNHLDGNGEKLPDSNHKNRRVNSYIFSSSEVENLHIIC